LGREGSGSQGDEEDDGEEEEEEEDEEAEEGGAGGLRADDTHRLLLKLAFIRSSGERENVQTGAANGAFCGPVRPAKAAPPGQPASQPSPG